MDWFKRDINSLVLSFRLQTATESTEALKEELAQAQTKSKKLDQVADQLNKVTITTIAT